MGLLSAFFGGSGLTDWEISECEQHITQLKKNIAGATDQNAKRFYKQQLIEYQDRLKRAKEKKRNQKR